MSHDEIKSLERLDGGGDGDGDEGMKVTVLMLMGYW